jgi:hypothetical protein
MTFRDDAPFGDQRLQVDTGTVCTDADAFGNFTRCSLIMLRKIVQDRVFSYFTFYNRCLS